MFIRLFTYATDENESRNIANDLFKNYLYYIEEIKYKKNEPYWKIEGLYKVEIYVKFKSNFDEITLEKFLKSISDKWVDFGNQKEEILASEKTDGCNYMKKGISMVNVFLMSK